MIPLLLAVALAAPADPEPPPDVPTLDPEEGALHDLAPVEPTPEEAAERTKRPYKLGGVVIPLFDYNTTDGVGLGVGVEVYDRKRAASHGYRNRVSAWTFWTTLGTYSSNYVQFEHRGKFFLVSRLLYRAWTDMIYVGKGGADVLINRPDSFTRGNTVLGPAGMVTAILPIPNSPVQVWMQGALRYTYAAPDPGGLLDQRQPYGLGETFLFDTAVGMSLQETDRWPLPNKGLRFELSGRAGGTVGPEGFKPLAGVNLEAIGWWPLVGEHLVLGGRLLVDKTFGERPFWDQEYVGGQFRDEMAEEQMLSGYARSRTRGDGVVAAVVELRPKFGQIHHPVFDIGFYGSVYAELGYLFDGYDLGPPLPTVGVGPSLLWQGAVEFRPFVCWGWLAEDTNPTGPRTPQMIIGIATSSPL